MENGRQAQVCALWGQDKDNPGKFLGRVINGTMGQLKPYGVRQRGSMGFGSIWLQWWGIAWVYPLNVGHFCHGLRAIKSFLGDHKHISLL